MKEPSPRDGVVSPAFHALSEHAQEAVRVCARETIANLGEDASHEHVIEFMNYIAASPELLVKAHAYYDAWKALEQQSNTILEGYIRKSRQLGWPTEHFDTLGRFRRNAARKTPRER